MTEKKAIAAAHKALRQAEDAALDQFYKDIKPVQEAYEKAVAQARQEFYRASDRARSHREE
jgi:hypothetical protein